MQVGVLFITNTSKIDSKILYNAGWRLIYFAGINMSSIVKHSVFIQVQYLHN